MKRTFATVALLAALGVFLKLTVREGSATSSSVRAPGVSTEAPTPPEPPAASDEAAALLDRYPEPGDHALVERTLKRYGHNALRIEHSDGLRGLALLDKLDLEAIDLYENHPSDFRRLRDALDDESAADILVHWREYFGWKRSDAVERSVLIAEVSRLGASARLAAARFPNALPLILTDPVGVPELIDRWTGDPQELEDALGLLGFVSLEEGPANLRRALRTLEHHGTLALESFRLRGMEGFALVVLYGPVLEALGGSPSLDDALVLMRVNSDELDLMLRTREPEAVTTLIRHLAAVGLTEAAGGSAHGLKLASEYGERGEQALRLAGADAADVVYEDFADPVCRSQAVEALAEHGLMALAMLDKYAVDPEFREVLRTFGARAIPPIARADTAPEALAQLHGKDKRNWKETLALAVLSVSGDNGQAVIRRMKSEGLERVESLESADVSFVQFLPLYDMIHLGGVVGRGYSPTSGEMAWALVDAGFVVVDVLSLAAIQPEGAAASEAARGQVKAAVRQAAKATVRDLGENIPERAARWWTVRQAGGTFRVLRRLPEALVKMTPTQLADLATPLARKAGLKLSSWAPVRLLVKGQEMILRIPPERGLKYVGAQMVQATVGLIGVAKMEEHLKASQPRRS